MLPALLISVVLVAAPQGPRKAEMRTLAFLGDSLTAGFGLEAKESFPALIEARLRAKQWPWKVINAGVSGDTTAGALRRVERLLARKVDVLFLCIGANDGLRGLPVEESSKNLRDIVAAARRAGATVVLAGVRLPENYGQAYRTRFEAMYVELAKKEKLTFLPFLLEGVAMKPELNQPDGIHPNETGAKRVAENVWNVLEPLLLRLSAKPR